MAKECRHDWVFVELGRTMTRTDNDGNALTFGMFFYCTRCKFVDAIPFTEPAS